MNWRRSRWIFGLVLASFAVASAPAGADEPNFTEQQKIDFMQHAKVIASKPEKKGTSNASHLTLSDGTVTYDASFQPIDERKPQGPAPGGGIELNFRDYWGYNIAGYRIAKLLGLDDMVPVYTERKWNGKTGAISWRVQDVQFDEAERHKRNISPPDQDAWARQMYKLRVLSQLFYDMDVNLTNVLVTKDWRIWRIDFSRAFRLQHDLKDPKDLVQCDRQVLAKLRQLTYDQVFDATKPYLTKDEVKALMARRDKMVILFDTLVAQKGESQVLYWTRPEVPKSLEAPAGEEVMVVAHAKGDQIYACRPGADEKFAWVLQGPEAELTDAAGKTIAQHFKGPTWKHVDGSAVTGEAVAKQDAPKPGAIPWLLLKAAAHTGDGVLSRVTSIQRIHTEGGSPPQAFPCDAARRATESRSAYSADYYFYEAGQK